MSYKPPPYFFNIKIISVLLLLLINVGAWFYVYGLHRAVSNGKKAQNSKWKYVPPQGIEPMTTCFPACRSNHSSRGRAYCTCFLSRFVEIPLPYFYCGSGEVEHVQTDDLFVLIVALRYSRGYIYFSHICTRLDLLSAFLAIDINNREVKHSTNVYV